MPQLIEPDTNNEPSKIYRIMVLDTKENIGLLTEACLRDGHQVVPVLTISEGMHFLDTKDHIDIVISRVHIETESVFDFLKEVKSRDHHKNVRFMMICSNPSEFAKAVDETVRTAAEIMGVDKYLTMSTYDVGRLMKEIEAIIPRTLPKKVQNRS
jgi:response regulator RpfG family c-di-GMP phosphodiesterase